jgi:hypothetical protein
MRTVCGKNGNQRLEPSSTEPSAQGGSLFLGFYLDFAESLLLLTDLGEISFANSDEEAFFISSALFGKSLKPIILTSLRTSFPKKSLYKQKEHKRYSLFIKTIY